jgi:hypothetical protein
MNAIDQALDQWLAVQRYFEELASQMDRIPVIKITDDESTELGGQLCVGFEVSRL